MSYVSKKSISKEELQDYPISRYKGRIEIIDHHSKISAAIYSIRAEQMVGIDTETRPVFKKGAYNHVALLQVATSNAVYLFRLNKIGLPLILCEFLHDNAILKAGIAFHDDIIDLQRLGNFDAMNILDLNDYCHKLGFESSGAKKLSALILGFRISKRQQTSNWEVDRLSPAQLEYAATDAWICREIYMKLNGNSTS